MGGRPNILLLSAQVPFTSGGAELLIDCLRRELKARDYQVDVVALPFAAIPKSALLKQIAQWRTLDLSSFAGRRVDLVIATKFPSYMVKHPCKVTWLVHQHRQLYELYGSRYGDFDSGPVDESLRRMVLQADRVALAECRRLYTISSNVSSRLRRYLDFESQPLPPPLPLGDRYYSAAPENFILSVGRLCSIKRVDLIIRALALVDQPLTLKVVGAPDEPAIFEYLKSEIDKHHLWHRVEFLGRVDEAELLRLFAAAFAVYYAPHDEDYGFVALEALASGRPVVTATDSGTVLEYIRHEVNGLVVEPDEKSVAEAFNRLLADSELYERIRSGTAQERPMLNWDQIIESLTAPVMASAASPNSQQTEPEAAAGALSRAR